MSNNLTGTLATYNRVMHRTSAFQRCIHVTLPITLPITLRLCIQGRRLHLHRSQQLHCILVLTPVRTPARWPAASRSCKSTASASSRPTSYRQTASDWQTAMACGQPAITPPLVAAPSPAPEPPPHPPATSPSRAHLHTLPHRLRLRSHLHTCPHHLRLRSHLHTRPHQLLHNSHHGSAASYSPHRQLQQQNAPSRPRPPRISPRTLLAAGDSVQRLEDL